MNQLELGFGNLGVNQIRSLHRTAEGYVKASKALHGHLTESAVAAIRVLENRVDEIMLDSPENFEAHRWAGKFYRMIESHGIVPMGDVDNPGGIENGNEEEENSL